jgi:apolipoprotein D and lipocalin family protein
MKRCKLFGALKRLLFLVPALLTGCVSVPSGIKPVQNFDLQRYLGTWYEIARLDHSFERGLSNVSATYTLRDDGGIDVLNKGFDRRAGQWKQAQGRAYFVSEPNVGHLKVSFFGPFYGSYIVIALDSEEYRYALVCGSNRSYLWILARETSLDRPVLDRLLTQARQLGFQTDQLIFVEHDRPSD